MLRAGTSGPQPGSTPFLSVLTSVDHLVEVRNCGLSVSREAIVLTDARTVGRWTVLISQEGELWNGDVRSLWNIVNCSVVWLEVANGEGTH